MTRGVGLEPLLEGGGLVRRRRPRRRDEAGRDDENCPQQTDKTYMLMMDDAVHFAILPTYVYLIGASLMLIPHARQPRPTT